MRRFILPLLLAALLVTLAACGGETPAEPDSPPAALEPDTPAGPDEAEEPAEPNEPEEPEKPEEPDEPEQSEEAEEPAEPEPALELRLVEQTGSYDNIQYDLPQLGVESGPQGAVTISHFYSDQAAKYLAYVRDEVAPAADGAQGSVTVTYEIGYNQGELLSVARLCTTAVGAQTDESVHTETFRVTDGTLVTPEVLFTGEAADYEAALLAQVREQLQGRGDLLPGWEDAVTASFDRNCFLLTQDAYRVYYAAGTLTAGLLAIDVPYAALADWLSLS